MTVQLVITTLSVLGVVMIGVLAILTSKTSRRGTAGRPAREAPALVPVTVAPPQRRHHDGSDHLAL